MKCQSRHAARHVCVYVCQHLTHTYHAWNGIYIPTMHVSSLVRRPAMHSGTLACSQCSTGCHCEHSLPIIGLCRIAVSSCGLLQQCALRHNQFVQQLQQQPRQQIQQLIRSGQQVLSTGCSMGLQQALATITQPVHATIYACHPACPLGPVMGVAGAPCASSATMVGKLLQQVISAAHGE